MTDTKPQNPKARKTKKSETLEVRLPYETKQAFLTACRDDGTTASEVVRGTIDDYLDARERPLPQSRTGRLLDMISQPIRKKRYLLAGAGVLAAGFAVALPSAAGPDMRAAFNRLDANRDGVLSTDEFEGAKAGADKKVVVIEHRTRTVDTDTDSPPPPANGPVVSEKAFAFWLPDSAGASGAKPAGDANQDHAVVIEKREVRINQGDGPEPQIVTDDFRKSEFDRFDANKDGKVTYSEYHSVQTAMLTSGFNLLDANHDHLLSQAEYAKIGSPMVIRAADDLANDQANNRANDQDDADASGSDVRLGGKPVMSDKALKTAFRKLDKNNDGKLSLEEYLP